MALSKQQLKFLAKVTPAAMAAEKTFGIPACVTISQAILESATAAGWGTSRLFTQANNPFGIKYCHFNEQPPAVSKAAGPALPAKSETVIPEGYGALNAETWEIENGKKTAIDAQFQRFPNLNEAFVAHSALLIGPRYAPAYDARADWNKFAALLGPKSESNPLGCGYSTNPGYAATLTQIVKECRLDDPRALAWYATGKDPGAQTAQTA